MTTTSEDEIPDTDESVTPPARSDVSISADIESDGPIPGKFSMLSLGPADAGHPRLTTPRGGLPQAISLVP